MAFCQQCGTQNPDGSRFCTGCGADLTAQAAPQQAAPVNPNMGGQQVYSQQPTYGQTPQAFAQSGIGNYGTPAGLSKKDFLNQPENAKLKNNLRYTMIASVVITILTLIMNIISIEREKAEILNTARNNMFYYVDEDALNKVVRANYTWLALLAVSAILVLAAYLALNMYVAIAGAVVYVISMIILLTQGGRPTITGIAMIAVLIFMPYNLFTLGKQYDEYKGRSGMNL